MLRKTLVVAVLFWFWSLGALLRAEELRYGVGSWDSESLGNHRVVVSVETATDAVWVHIPWRRKDQDPQRKNIIVMNAEGRRVRNVFRATVNRESADLLFQAATPGQYYLYYMPFVSSGRSAYPTVTYQEPERTAEVGWLRELGFSSAELSARPWEALPQAKVVEMQSIDEFNSFYPMEVIATKEEVDALLKEHAGASYLLFPESRENPIRMRNDIPYKWIKEGSRKEFAGAAAKGEFYAFQIGLYAPKRRVDGLEIGFTDLESRSGGNSIPSSALRCFNLGGLDWLGRPLEKEVSVEVGQVQALWFGVDIPIDTDPGIYQGKILVNPKGVEEGAMTLSLEVLDYVIADGGDSEPWKHSRLRWLDSTIASDHEVVAPFTPLKVEGMTTRCLGRSVALGGLTLPSSIRSFFAPEMTNLSEEGMEILGGPIRFLVEGAEGVLRLEEKDSGPQMTFQAKGTVRWGTEVAGDTLKAAISSQMEFDGVLEYSIRLEAIETTALSDVRLEIPVRQEVARYMMGLGFKGGYRPEKFDWKWDRSKNQDSVWVGEVNGGIQVALYDENYERPLNTNFYLLKPLKLPPSWHNEGNGGIRLEEIDPSTLLISAYSGHRVLDAGDQLNFKFRLSVTPFKLLNTEAQWQTRFFHRYAPVNDVVSAGANTVNVHHATEINPYINYPFFRTEEMKAYVDEAHFNGLKVKIYHTVRELTNRAPELFALLSLGDEVFFPGPGGGPAWLQEHVDYPYIAGWFVPKLKDAALVNSGVSRWHNYYLESLDWLVRNVGIDGLYIDDVAFDRTVMKRVRKILDRGREGALIDLHSANQFNVRDGYANSANLYLEHFPYLDRLWFGEYFDYDSSPDFWMVEVSGIPFGLMGEMLQDGGNPYRGMLYGMTSRTPWSEDPPKLWRLWNEFGIEGSRMIGYWVPSCPVRSGHPEVLATVYSREKTALVCLASWSRQVLDCRLEIDWDALGLDPKKARLIAPQVGDLQASALFEVDETIPVSPRRGWFLIVAEE